MQQNEAIKKTLNLLIGVIIAIFIVNYYASVIMMMINTFSAFDGGCWFRYTNNNGVLTTSVLSNLSSVKVRGNANYKTIGVTVGSNSYYVPDPRHYGEYVASAPLSINAGSNVITLSINGNVSLCKSYLPAYDLQTGKPVAQNLSGAALTGASNTITSQTLSAAATAATDDNRTRGGGPAVQSTNPGIPIPRVGDAGSLALRFPANTGRWRNVVELFPLDSIQLVVGDPAISTNVSNLSSVPTPLDAFNGNSFGVDCTATTQPYVTVPAVNAASANDTMIPVGMKPDPVCGRFTPYANANYIAECRTTKVTTCRSYRGWQCACGLSCPIAGTLELNCHTSGPDANGDCNFTHSTDNNGSTIVGCCGGGNDGRSISYPITTVMSATLAPTAFTGGAFAPANAVGGRVFSSLPAGSPNTFPRSNNIRDYLKNYNSHACIPDNSPLVGATSGGAVTNNNAFKAQVQNYNFWLTQGNGLMLKVSTTGVVPGSIGNVTSLSFRDDIPGPMALPQLQQNMLAGVPSTQGNSVSSVGNLLYSNSSVQSNSMSGSLGGYLQLGYIDNGSPTTQNAGGYTIYINHTKCKRANGQALDDSYYNARGQIKYAIAPSACDMNATPQCPPGYTVLQNGTLNFNGGQTLDLTINNNAQFQLSTVRMWFLIDNKYTDYQDSNGEYDISINQKERVGQFSGLVLTPLMDKVKGIIDNAGKQMFQNLTCYGLADKSKCFDFFKYIRAMLTLYIFIFGAMFAIGKIQLNQKEFLTHAVKVIFIGGLLNGDTFNFFNSTVFPFIMGFSAEIIANFGGYSNANPFTFLDEVLDKLLFSKLGLFQMLALISGGLTGLAMFLMTAISIVVFISGVFRALCIFIFAQLILSFLLGIAPLFLTFLLFKETRDLFQKWLNNVIKYMIEPVIVVMGLAIFTKLFAVYMDNVLGYSVCFKCAIPFKIPTLVTSFIPNFPSQLQDIQLFCFYWFGPWGVDSSLGLISLPIPYIIGMGLIAFCNYTYIGLVPTLVTELTGIASQASSVDMGVAAAKGAEGALASSAVGAKNAGQAISRKIQESNANKQEPSINSDEKRPSTTNSKPIAPSGGQGGKAATTGDKPKGLESFESKAQKRTAKGGGIDAQMLKRASEGKSSGGAPK